MAFSSLLSALVFYLLGSVYDCRGQPIEVPASGSLAFAPFLDISRLKPPAADSEDPDKDDGSRNGDSAPPP